MIPHYSKIHNRFQINGMHHHKDGLVDFAYSCIKEGEPFEKTIGNFMLNWLDEKDHIEAKTSGSTGDPKIIRLSKQSMVHSAIASGDYFKLEPGDKILHCLPSDYIAGKMMFVRAIILGLELDLVEPTSQPIFDYNMPYDFCAMVPLQLQRTYQYCENINTIIVGGAAVPQDLCKKLEDLKTSVFATYGMTETLSHIAVKPLNEAALKKDSSFKSLPAFYKTFPKVHISQDEQNCLVIEAEHLFEGKLVTNDIVEILSPNTFEFLGRFDNVINSGGVKLFPEQIEKKLSSKIDDRFFITSIKDNELGEKVVLVLESESIDLEKNCFNGLDKFETPREILNIPEFVETKSGKIQKEKTLALL
ncbi:MAG: AMP-binding protein [Bacteroidia bacterium]|nr:AMP-binding protein [Bacteroidia bacterium]NND09853.1 AMP-binding protein [Flavobacteriaceae bacterium]NNK27699.1 AMP-binding protein [Flavobacteriaceae bacterium]